MTTSRGGGLIGFGASAGRLLVGALLVFSLVGPAGAAATESTQVYDTVEECIEAIPFDVDFRSWSCVGSDEQGWTPRVSSSGIDGTGAFGTFLVVALLWSGVPLLIAASMASSRGESKASAVGLTLVLGWVGLAIVWFGQRKALSAVEGLAVAGGNGLGASSDANLSARSGTKADDSAATRLRELDRLREQGLINEAEYGEQRQRILGQI